MSSCVFCRIASGEEWAAKVWEEDEFVAFMDIYPVSVGHTLVSPKRHLRDIFEMDTSTIAQLYILAARIARAIKEALDPDGINILQNNGAAAGQVIFHAHVHVIPRSSEDAPLFRGSWRRKEVSREELLKTALRIREKMR